MGNVIKLESAEARAAAVRLYLAKSEPPLRIETVREALSYGDQWRAYAYRMEALLALVTAQRDASETLLRIAYEEIERLRGLIE